MIKPFVGSIIDYKTKAITRVKKVDGWFFGQCDVCGATLPDDQGGTLVTNDSADFNDAAYAECWKLIGERHLICDTCERLISRGAIKISIKRRKK